MHISVCFNCEMFYQHHSTEGMSLKKRRKLLLVFKFSVLTLFGPLFFPGPLVADIYCRGLLTDNTS